MAGDSQNDGTTSGHNYEAQQALLIRLFSNAHGGTWDNLRDAAGALATLEDSDANIKPSILTNSSIAEALLSCKDGRLWTCLHFAAAGGNLAVVKELVVMSPSLALAQDEAGLTSLMLAAKHGHKEVCEVLHAACPEAIKARTKTGATALHCAIQADRVAIAAILLKYNKSMIDALCSSSGTALFCATEHACREESQFILGIEKPTSTSFASLRLLIDNGANVNLTEPPLPPPLLLAATLGQKYVTSLLLDAGADIRARDAQGWTALQSAAEEGHLACMELLLTHASSTPGLVEAILSDTTQGTTALDVAKKNGHTQIVQLLEKWGAQEGTCNIDNDKSPAENHEPQRTADDLQPHQSSLTDDEEAADAAALAHAGGLRARVNKSQAEALEEVEKLKAWAAAELRKGKWDEVLQLYQKALDICPLTRSARRLRATLYCNRSLVFLKTGQLQAALGDAKQALKYSPGWHKALWRQARAMEALGNLDEAAQIMWEAAAHSEDIDAKSQAVYRNDFSRLLLMAKEKHRKRQTIPPGLSSAAS